MRSLNGKTALVTGASSGIGKSAAEALLEAGARVYVAARRIEKMMELETLGAVSVKMDVADEESVKTGIDTILEKEKSIDILINNAGYGSYGAIEDVPLEEAKRQFEVNLFGLARLIQLVLPGMRNNRYGKIVNISSMGGRMHTPFGAWYHATKYALEGFTDCLRLEVSPFGIDPILIEPGGIKTDWGIIAAENLERTSGSGAYAAAAKISADGLKKMYSGSRLTDPGTISRTILKAVTARKPKTRYAVGYMAKPAIFLRKVISDRAFDRIISAMI